MAELNVISLAVKFNKNGSSRLQMTGGFQIWSQNLNRTTFTPFLAWQNPAFDNFWLLFGPKRGQMSSDLNFETRFGILWSFADPSLLIFSNLCFCVLHCNFKLSYEAWGHFFFEFEIYNVRFGISVPKDINMGSVAIALPKIW